VLPLALVWFASSLAETNRTPFDFAEGESELVSGFNVEYRRGGFALIFIAEYASILFISMLFVVLFIGGETLRFYFYFKLTLISFGFVWVRGTLPRFRYDKLIYMAWKSFLPVALNFLVFFRGVRVLIF
jgi:NADH-ubiquinone oxidoreductase chain 1